MKKFLTFTGIFFIIFISNAQNPPSIHWKQLETKHFRVIFPEEITDYAVKTASFLDTVYYADTKIFIDNHPKKIDLILTNKSVQANAYAALVPRRMTWYLTPPSYPSLTLTPWHKVLAIHEFRHVTQYAKLNDGFTRLGYFAFGRMGQAILQNWSIPNWFMEGDAVFNETVLSNSGRGRMPAFSLPVRTILLTDQNISYEKALFRSYRTYYPDHYYLGYHLVTYINRHYGEEIWNDILFRSSLYSFWPYTFERSIKKYTGDNVRKTYKKAMLELDSLWSDQLAKADTQHYDIVNAKNKKSWTNYFDPQIVSKDTLLVLKSGFDEITSLYYLFADGSEKRISEIAGSNISYAGNKVVWTEYKPDIRYSEQSFNDIVIFDLTTRKKTKLTKKGKYFSPAISHDAKKIVAVSIPEKLVPELVIFDDKGNKITSKVFPETDNVLSPAWLPDNKTIVFLTITDNGENLCLWDTEKNTVKFLIKDSKIKFDKPFADENFVFFNYDYTGITNIFAYELKTGKIFQVTSVPFGAKDVVADKNNNVIYFSNYDDDGLDICKMPYNPQTWTELQKSKQNPVFYFESEKTKSQISSITGLSEQKNYQITDYKLSKNAINFHSWQLFANTNNDLGFYLFSNNVLNTLAMTTSIMGNIKKHSLYLDNKLTWQKFYPVVDFSINAGQRGEILTTPDTTLVNWFQTSSDLNVTLPFNLSSGLWYRKITFSAGTSFKDLRNFSPGLFDELDIDYTQLLTTSANFSFTNRKYRSFRDIIPRHGQEFDAGIKYVPKVFDLSGELFYAKAKVYFPSVFKHHAFSIAAEYEQKTDSGDDVYNFSPVVSFPRGYTAFYTNTIAKISADYVMPLFYPDWNVPYLLFVKRIRTDAFFDYALIGESVYKSAGVDIVADFNLLRINYFTFNAGVRSVYLYREKNWKFIPLIMGAEIKF